MAVPYQRFNNFKNFNKMKSKIHEHNTNNNYSVSNLPNVIAELVKTQNNFDSAAYAKCFTETAVVFDEGKTHNGRKEIENWIDKANKEYQATMKPLGYAAKEAILKVEVSGNFPGSPIALSYHLQISDGLIQSLKITG